VRIVSEPEVKLIGAGILLNGIWEFLQSPFYADHDRGTLYIVWSRLHCTAGDVVILLASYWITSLVFRTRSWPTEKGWYAGWVFIASGLSYTVWSEWFNTRIAQGWAYAPAMPLVFGIGMAPLLQWLVIPSILVYQLRRRKPPEHDQRPQ